MNRFGPEVKLSLQPNFQRFVAGGRVYPTSMEISPCHVCNAHCDECFYRETHLKMGPDSIIDSSVLKRVLWELSVLRCKTITWTGGGEPTLHPDFPKFLTWAAAGGFQQGLFTNGLLPLRYDPSHLEWIRVSFTDHGWKPEILKQIRKKAKALGMCINYKGDEAGVMDALKIADDVEADYVQVRPALGLKGEMVHRIPPTMRHPKLVVSDYKFEAQSKPHGYCKCMGYNFSAFLWHTGNLDVCAYHRETGGDYTLGNVKNETIKDIFDRAPRGVPVIGTCQIACKNHEINRFLDKADSIADRNFI